MAFLLQGTANRRGVKGHACRQVQYSTGNGTRFLYSARDNYSKSNHRRSIDYAGHLRFDFIATKHFKTNFKKYPQKWGLKSTDKNIDHRRVPNIQTYFQRQGYVVKDQNFKAGDIVTWDLGKGLVHIGIVSNQTTLFSKTPLIIHNIGRGTQENDILHEYKITGHYRLPTQLK